LLGRGRAVTLLQSNEATAILLQQATSHPDVRHAVYGDLLDFLRVPVLLVFANFTILSKWQSRFPNYESEDYSSQHCELLD
jgi:hypothetical protein